MGWNSLSRPVGLSSAPTTVKTDLWGPTSRCLKEGGSRPLAWLVRPNPLVGQPAPLSAVGFQRSVWSWHSEFSLKILFWFALKNSFEEFPQNSKILSATLKFKHVMMQKFKLLKANMRIHTNLLCCEGRVI
jgi:hypothetical protein